jgi:hypothetical protein
MDGETLVEQNAKHTCRMRILHGPIYILPRLVTVCQFFRDLYICFISTFFCVLAVFFAVIVNHV